MEPLARLGAFMFTLTLAPPIVAATYIVPPDADLIRSADAIAVVQIQSSRSYYTADGLIATDHSAIVETVLKSQLRQGMTIVITQHGGVVGDAGFGLSSEPPFAIGERTLVALRQLDRRRYTTLSGELGKFSFAAGLQARSLLVRGAADSEIFGWDPWGRVHIDRPRDADAFVRYIAAVVGGQTPVVDYFVSEQSFRRDVRANSHVGPYEYSLRGNPRWHGNAFEVKNINTEAAEPNTIGILAAAIAGWNGAPNATINITHGGSDPAGALRRDRKNVVLFGHPDSGALAGNTVAVAGWWSSGSHTFNGVTYGSMADCDIVVEVNRTGTRLQGILGHELGHCLGFRHSSAPQPGQTTETSVALMNSATGGDPSLRDWDRDAASHLYGGGVRSCEPAGIVAHPEDVTLDEGSSATLSVSARGSNLLYQWYVGTAGDRSNPIPEETWSSVTVSPATTTSYWVFVSQSCDGDMTTVDSNTATVTVSADCISPLITAQTEATRIAPGGTATLTVTATGTAPLAYQWYEGTAGITTTPVGTDSSSFTTSPLTASTQFWVNVTNGCGSAASAAMTVSVGSGGRRRAVRP